MLKHFLDNTGQPYTLSAADISEIKTDASFLAVLGDNIHSKFPMAGINGHTTKVQWDFTHYFGWGPSGDNNLFYAFGTTNIAYEGNVSTCVKTKKDQVKRGTYDLTVTVSKPLYNFLPATHGWYDYFAPSFEYAYELEKAGYAKPFSASGTFQLKGSF
jgi:hypothetical protein